MNNFSCTHLIATSHSSYQGRLCVSASEILFNSPYRLEMQWKDVEAVRLATMHIQGKPTLVLTIKVGGQVKLFHSFRDIQSAEQQLQKCWQAWRGVELQPSQDETAPSNAPLESEKAEAEGVSLVEARQTNLSMPTDHSSLRGESLQWVAGLIVCPIALCFLWPGTGVPTQSERMLLSSFVPHALVTSERGLGQCTTFLVSLLVAVAVFALSLVLSTSRKSAS